MTELQALGITFGSAGSVAVACTGGAPEVEGGPTTGGPAPTHRGALRPSHALRTDSAGATRADGVAPADIPAAGEFDRLTMRYVSANALGDKDIDLFDPTTEHQLSILRESCLAAKEIPPPAPPTGGLGNTLVGVVGGLGG